MTAPSPDDLPGLVEAVAEAERRARSEHQRVHLTSATCSCGGWWAPSHADELVARAAVAAMVEHLACPTPCDDDCEVVCHEMHAVKWRRSHDPAICVEVRARLVTPWREVQP